jgi:hypothetical protein
VHRCGRCGNGVAGGGGDRWGRPGRGRREERALGRGAEGNELGGRARPTRGEGKERRVMGCWAAEEKREGEKGWAGVPHAGVRRGKGAREREGAGLLGSLSFTSSSLFLLHTQTIQTIHLNSNEFEFKLYTLHTNKTNAPA